MSPRAGREKKRSPATGATGATGATPQVSVTSRGRGGDARRWIYGGLDLLLAATCAIAVWTMIPNRLLSAQIHLWTFPPAMLAMAAGTLLGTPKGWWIAVVGGSLILLSTFALILRIVISAAFLAGVYGAFGRTAAILSLVMAAVVIELVALLPILQVKYLMTRAGRRAYGRHQRV